MAKIIGITGGIGSGKSYVAAVLQERFDIPVYDCDREAKRLTATDADIRQKLIALVGDEVFRGGILNKKCLADFLFASPENASQVNAIIHPAVLTDFAKWSREQQQHEVVGLESAILFDSGLDGMADRVIFVDAPEEVRLRRAMLRDTASEEEIRARMRMQQHDANRRQADFVVDNSTADDTRLPGLLNEIIRQVTPPGTRSHQLQPPLSPPKEG